MSSFTPWKVPSFLRRSSRSPSPTPTTTPTPTPSDPRVLRSQNSLDTLDTLVGKPATASSSTLSVATSHASSSLTLLSDEPADRPPPASSPSDDLAEYLASFHQTPGKPETVVSKANDEPTVAAIPGADAAGTETNRKFSATVGQGTKLPPNDGDDESKPPPVGVTPPTRPISSASGQHASLRDEVSDSVTTRLVEWFKFIYMEIPGLREALLIDNGSVDDRSKEGVSDQDGAVKDGSVKDGPAEDGSVVDAPVLEDKSMKGMSVVGVLEKTASEKEVSMEDQKLIDTLISSMNGMSVEGVLEKKASEEEVSMEDQKLIDALMRVAVLLSCHFHSATPIGLTHGKDAEAASECANDHDGLDKYYEVKRALNQSYATIQSFLELTRKSFVPDMDSNIFDVTWAATSKNGPGPTGGAVTVPLDYRTAQEQLQLTAAWLESHVLPAIDRLLRKMWRSAGSNSRGRTSDRSKVRGGVGGLDVPTMLAKDSSDHVDSNVKQKHLRPTSSALPRSPKTEAGNKYRQAIAVDVDEGGPSLLSPLLSRFSLNGIPSFKSFIPSSPSVDHSSQAEAKDRDQVSWQTIDLGDGAGPNTVLVTSSKENALQLWKVQLSRLPTDEHVKETFPPPEEVCCIRKIGYDHTTQYSSLSGPFEHKTSNKEKILQASILSRQPGDPPNTPPLAALLTSTEIRRNAHGHHYIALVIIDLKNGVAIKRIHVGIGASASFTASTRAIVVALSHPTPKIYCIHPSSFRLLCLPITYLPVSPTTCLPIFALSGRLLSITTSEPPQSLGVDQLGSVVSLSSVQSPQTLVSPRPQLKRVPRSGQRDYLSSAVEIGGGVARGVWAGLRAGAKAANQARNNRLARSAPEGSSGGLADQDEDQCDERKSLGDSSLFDDLTTTSNGRTESQWIKVFDLGPRQDLPSSLGDSSGSSNLPILLVPVLVAHFCLPPSRSSLPTLYSAIDSQRLYKQHLSISYLSFSKCGTKLLAAQDDGRACHVFGIRPAGAKKLDMPGECKGLAWHLYELRRGNTAATVINVEWSRDGRWVGVATGRGTIHIFPMNPDGGMPSVSTHVPLKVINSTQLPSLSTVVTPYARLRSPYLAEDTRAEISADNSSLMNTHFAFMTSRADPLLKGHTIVDTYISRIGAGQIELARLDIHAAVSSLTDTPSTKETPMGRVSGLTEMMRSRARLVAPPELHVTSSVKARWLLPDNMEGSSSVFLSSSISSRQTPSVNLAHAEIQTHSVHPHVLPSSIYLWRQVDFFSARAIDEYSPLSIMDIEARTRRLIFRFEVEARPGSPEEYPFTEPLSTALHSALEATPDPQLPRLPNGYPARPAWRAASIPIRQVAQGLGEGVHRVTQEYKRQNHKRIKRRVSEAQANKLSFEEDTIFPPAPEHLEEGVEDASPPSSDLPATNTGSSVDEEWGGWEDEYMRAVEDDGGPDDLVLGLLDEEEEERKRLEKKKAEEQRAKDAKEAEEWKSGAKGLSKGEVAAAKAAEQARKKAEKEALIAAEEASISSKTKSAPKAGSSKKKPASDTLKATGTGLAGFSVADPLGLRKKGVEEEQVTELSATGIEDMLEALEVVNAKTDKDAMGAKAGLIERHPERRFKAAFNEYLDRELPKLKEEHPGLRQNQMRDMLFKQFQKAPENPFNQAQVAYNANKEEKVGALQNIMDAREAKYKVDS
ncbi:hypothetical protein M231_00679 [Tremella mesenterica]|uniref:BCAS3 domain-containing protein n=1 Tax=Tremella mesenterica TaxID=5217 RepID=A0A4Q1BV75_TREME|nr:hypothetical protein M231_00679 [Tremella mesenterica]